MSALTSLLVRDRVVPVSKIEEALQHQVLTGGDIETILLEMNLVPEDVLAAYRAALFGLLPATREEVMKATREALRKVPRELARGAGFVPLSLEGRTLIIAASEPPAGELSKQIKAQLGCELSVRIVTQARLAAALGHHYGYELELRVRRLAESLRKREPGVIPYVKPPAPSLSSRPPGSSGSIAPVKTGFESAPDTLERALLPEVRDDGAQIAGFTLSEPALNDLVSTAGAAAEVEVGESGESELEEGSQPQRVVPYTPDVGMPSFGRAHSSTIPPPTVSPHIARGVRGPIDRERALELLGEATSRDDVLFVLLRYVQQFFDFAALFSLGKEGARGRMAHGAGLSAELMEQVVIPLHGTGLVARAARDKRPIVGDLSHTDEERAAAALLGRPAGRPGLAVPIVLRSRTVLLVYGDREAEGVTLDDAEPLAQVAVAVSEALRRLIVESKTLRGGGGSSPPPSSGAPPNRSGTSSPVSGAASSGMPAAPTSMPAAAPGTPPARPAVLPSRRPGPTAKASERPRESFEPMAMLASAVVRAAELEALHTESRLTAVDLETVAGAPGRDRRRETAPLHGAPEPANDLEQARARKGARESQRPAARAGTYSYTAGSGLSEEKVRTSRPQRDSLSQQAPVESMPTPAVEPAPAPAAQRPSQVARMRQSQPVVDSGGPSMIVDMGDQVGLLVDSLLHAQANQEPAEIAELLKIGEAALPVLMQRFPGPLWFDRRSPHKRRARGRDVSAVARAIVAFGDRAAPYLASALASSDPDQCYYALIVAGEVVHPDLLDAVARHALGPDEELRAVALEVLRGYAGLPQFGAVLTAIGELSARAGKDGRRQRLAIEALGELRDQRALKALLPRLSDATEPVVQAAHRALVTLTGQDFGLAQRKWEAWAEQWGSAHRVEWLIESLLHADDSVRALAGEELKQLTQQYFGYHPALPRRDRELAQRKYREWWEAEGRDIFYPS
jgi:hypothetical protein